MQTSGLLITSLDLAAGSISATSSDSQFSDRPDSGFFEEVGLILAHFVGVLPKFKERISVNIDDDGSVHALSVSEPRTIILDQGRNRRHILTLWKALDGILRPQAGSMNITNDNSVTITGNTGAVQNASPHAQQHYTASAVDCQVLHGGGYLAEVASFLAQALTRIDQLKLTYAESMRFQAELAVIREQAESPSPKRHIIQESLHSIRAMLENASGGAAAVGLLDLLHHLNM
jgi:hypothetical protein